MAKYLKKKKNKWLPVVVISIVLVIVGGVILMLSDKQISKIPLDKGNTVPEETILQEQTLPLETQGQFEQQETLAVQEEPEELIEIQTKYCVLQYPALGSDYLSYREVTEGSVSMVIFSMVSEEAETELFRVYFGNPEVGNVVGKLTADGDDVPVSYTVCSYNMEDFPDEQTQDRYLTIMDGLNVVLRSIENTEGYTDVENSVIAQNQIAKLEYWDVELPVNMCWEEQREGELYRVLFYGNFNGERVDLFAFALGEPAYDSIIGNYQVNGKQEILSLHSFELPATQNWTEKAVDDLYAMLDGVNGVLHVIMESDAFSYGEEG